MPNRIAIGAGLGGLAGALAGVVMLVAVASESRGRPPRAAAEMAGVVQIVGWLAILIVAAVAAFGKRAVGAAIIPIVFGLFAAVRGIAPQLAKTKGNPTAGVDPPGFLTVLAAAAIGALAGAICAWRISRRPAPGPDTSPPHPAANPQPKGNTP
jgi:hypothetical protein